MRSALLIGGTGFVGPHLARQLSGRYAVTATGRDCDVRDRQAIGRIVAASKPDVVAVLAAITTVRETVEDPRATYDTAFYGLLNVFEALAAAGFKGRVLGVSSSEVYGFPDAAALPLTETSPVRPMSPYAVAKLAAESLCHQWAHSAAFEVVVARPFTHIGPGQSDRFAVARFAREIAEIVRGKRTPELKVGNLGATRDLSDVRDVARAYDLLLHRGANAEVYNVCSDREVVMRNVLDTLIGLSGRRIEVIEDRALTRAAEQQRLCGSYAKLSAATGWSPQIPLQQTLGDTLAAALTAA